MYMYIEYHFYADKSIISYVKERTDTQYQTIYNLDVSILRSLFENVFCIKRYISVKFCEKLFKC